MLDPFSEIATTCIVTKKLGRDFIGIELNPKYVSISNKKLNKYKENNALLEILDGKN